MSGLKRDYTKVPNEILRENQLSITARLLYIDLLRYQGNDDRCYPSQQTLASDLGLSTRQIRTRLNELIKSGIVFKFRKGFNRPNTYKVSNILERKQNRKPNSYHVGSIVPLHSSQEVPPNSTYRKGKVNISKEKMEKERKKLIESFSIK